MVYSRKNKRFSQMINTCNNILIQNESMCELKSNKRKKKCSDYNLCKKLFNSYTTPSAPKYNTKKWSNPIVEGSHNCYVYALDDINNYTKNRCKKTCKKNKSCKTKDRECSKYKPQPGKYAFLNNTRSSINKTYTCEALKKAILDDNPFIKEIKFNERCKKGYYKIALVVEPNNTYHFYRLDRRGKWSHKPGTEPVTDKDASNNYIYAPHLADRNYNKYGLGGINYNRFCYYFSVPNNTTIKTRSK